MISFPRLTLQVSVNGKDGQDHHGFVIEETAYIMRSELILLCRKVELEDRARSDAAAAASTDA